LIQPGNVKDTGDNEGEISDSINMSCTIFQEIFLYLSVSLGTISIMSFGLKVSALLMNLFARIAFNPKGGLRPMISLDPCGSSFGRTVIQSRFSKQKEFCKMQLAMSDPM
jgi:hypothetical protein